MTDTSIALTEFCLDPWPSWSRRWFGRVVRILVLGLGSLAGLVLIWLANWAASGLRGPPAWDGEAVAMLITGIATIGVSILLAARPTRGTVTLATLDVVWIPFLGNLL